jgi:hypothetical protein
MHTSLQALLRGLVDYAGLFPPAKLPFPEALANYRRYRDSSDAWMLGRFICPAARLHEIPEGVALNCAALARGGDTTEAFLSGLDADLADIAASRARGVRVEVLEAKLPVALLAQQEEPAQLLREIKSHISSAELPVFFEVPIDDQVRLGHLIAAFKLAQFTPPAGFKLRAGGLEASAFPSSEQIAQALSLVLREAVPFKATAGLHHPFPRFDPGGQARMHGFINLFTAAVLLKSHSLGVMRMVPILEDDDPAHFHFTDEGVRWNDLFASTSVIEQVRQKEMLSFGSCSFDEPRDDLRVLGWL